MTTRPVPPELGALAARILAWEASQPGAAQTPPIKRALARLHDQMVHLVGSVGFHALVRRAIHLAKQDHAKQEQERATQGQVRQEHAWVGPAPASEPPASDEQAAPATIPGELHASEGSVMLLAHLLGLFGSFIGDDLTLLLIRRAWGDLPLVEGQGLASKETTS